MYKNFYNFSENPFQLNPNLDFLFESAGHKRAKAYLRYGLKQGEGFVVVIGQAGTGKTMLVKELFKSIEQDKNIITGLMVTSQLNPEDTLRVFANIFNVEYERDDNKATLLLKIRAFFSQCAQLGKRVLLVADESQNLSKESIEELRMMTNFEAGGRVIFQVFLVGQEELGLLIYSSGMEQVKQRVVATYYLKAMSANEIKQYILFRLSKVGWENNPVFVEEVFAEIYNFTQGIPRRINTLCDRLLLYGYLEELSEIDLKSTKYVISEIKADNVFEIPEVIENLKNKPVPAFDLTQEQRIDVLEKKVAELNIVLTKERALLRKAVLIQLDMDDAFL